MKFWGIACLSFVLLLFASAPSFAAEDLPVLQQTDQPTNAQMSQFELLPQTGNAELKENDLIQQKETTLPGLFQTYRLSHRMHLGLLTAPLDAAFLGFTLSDPNVTGTVLNLEGSIFFDYRLFKYFAVGFSLDMAKIIPQTQFTIGSPIVLRFPVRLSVPITVSDRWEITPTLKIGFSTIWQSEAKRSTVFFTAGVMFTGWVTEAFGITFGFEAGYEDFLDITFIHIARVPIGIVFAF